MSETIHEKRLWSLTSRRAADIAAALAWAEDADSSAGRIRGLEYVVAKLVDEVSELEAEVKRLREAARP